MLNDGYAKSGFFLVLLLFSLGSLSAADHIEWEEVEGADYYWVEIKQDDILILETRSDVSHLPLFLPVGDYQFRVSVMNVFGKSVTTSQWYDIKIREATNPFILEISSWSTDSRNHYTFSSRVTGFQDNKTSFHLEDDAGITIPLEIVNVEKNQDTDGNSWEKITLKTFKKKPHIGDWFLVMTNPNQHQSRIKTTLSITKSQKTKIIYINPRALYTDTDETISTLEVQGMEPGAEIRFTGTSEIHAVMIKNQENRFLEYRLDTSNAEPGWYSITIANPSGDTVTRDKAFRVFTRSGSRRDNVEDERKDFVLIHDYPRSLSLGYSMDIPVGLATDTFDNNYFTIGARYSQFFFNDIFHHIRALHNLSWGTGLNYSQLNQFSQTFIQLHYYLGLSYSTQFNFPVNVMIRMDSGFTLTNLNYIDYILRLGPAIQFSITPRFFVDLGAYAELVIDSKYALLFIQPYAELGLRW